MQLGMQFIDHGRCRRLAEIKKEFGMKLILTAAFVGVLMLAFSLPAYAQQGPPGPPDTGALPNAEPAANETGHSASCDAQGDNLTRAAGNSEGTPASPALEFDHDVQCD